MEGVKLSKYTSLIFLGLLTSLFRFPVTESPTGSDNFYYITMVKSIINHGQIIWAVNISSFYGLYPGTTPLGGSILAVSVVGVTGISVHQYHLFHSITISLLSTFGFFLLSGEFTSNYKSRWISSLAFSLAPRILLLSIWRFSLRFLFVAFLPIFIWLILRTMNQKYGRNPIKILYLLAIFILILPSLHRLGLLVPGFILSFFISCLLWNWQENAINRERAGRQIFVLSVFLSAYLFYLNYLDLSPYAPDKDLFAVYYLNEGSLFSSIINMGVYYLINVGPMITLSIIGFIFWVQEGRIPFSYMFAMSCLFLSAILITDLIYIPFIVTFLIIIFVIPGMDFFIDNLENFETRLRVFFVSALILTISFSSMDLFYRLDAIENDDYNYSYNVRDSSISAGFWIGENFYSEIIESNDRNRQRRVAAYSDSVSISDLNKLSSGKIVLSDMEISRVPILDFYLESKDHIWEWENKANQSNLRANLSIVNIAMSNFEGQASTNTLVVSAYYKSMPNYNFKIYFNDELALYWTNNY